MVIVAAIIIVKIFAIVVGFICFKHLETGYKLLLFQVVFALIAEVYGIYFAAIYKANNLWIFNIYTLIEIWLLLIAGRYFIISTKFKKYINYILPLITLVWAAEAYLQGLDMWVTKTVVSGSILVMIVYFKALFDNVLFSKTVPFRLPIFWISLSLILFFGCILPFMALYNVFNTHYIELSKVFTRYLINVVNFLRYPMVGIAFYLHSEEKVVTDKLKSGYAK